MTEEYMNVFDRAHKTRSKHLNKQDAETSAKREIRKEADIQRWNIRGQATGVVLDEKTAAAKLAYEQDRVERQQKAIPPAARVELSSEELQIIFEAFIERNPEFVDTPFNRSNLWKATTYNVSEGKLESFSLNSLSKAFRWLKSNGYFEAPKIRPRGTAIGVPKVFPAPPAERTESAEQQEAARQQIIDDEIIARESELREAKSLSFEELRRKVQSRYNYDRAASSQEVSHV